MRIFVAALLVSLAVPAFAADPQLKTEEEKTVYAFGVALSNNVKASLTQLDLTPAQIKVFSAGLSDGLSGVKPKVDMAVYEKKAQEWTQKKAQAGAEKAKAAAAQRKEKEKAEVAKLAKEKGAVTTASGLVYIPVREGKGESPKADDKVRVNYEGKLLDGKVFDSSYQRGQPIEFPLKGVIPCWTEGVQKMKVGGEAKLVCPPSIAYGDQGTGPIPGGSTLVFKVELLGVTPGGAAPAGK